MKQFRWLIPCLLLMLWASGAQAQFVRDTFTDTGNVFPLSNHTGEIGATWTLVGGSTGNQIQVYQGFCNGYGQVGPNVFLASGTGTDGTGYTIAIPFTTSTATNDYTGPIFQSNGTSYYAILWNGTLGTLTLYNYASPAAGGTLVTSWSNSAASTVGNHTWTIHVEFPATGQVKITPTVDSSALAAYTITSGALRPSTPRIGLHYYGIAGSSNVTGIQFDSLTATNDSSGIAQSAPTIGTTTATSVPLSWTAATGATGAVTYDVLRNTTNTTSGATTLVSGQSGTTYTNTGLSGAYSYYYFIVAHDAGTSTSVTSTGAGPAVPPISATSFTFAGPASLAAGVQSGNFTLTPNGATTASVSLSDGGAGGTFAPTSLTLSDTTPVTFKYTPPSGSGGNTIVITPTAGGLTASPTTLSYVVPAQLATLNLGGIGDSIEAGTLVGAPSAPIVESATLLQTLHGTRTVYYINQAVSAQRTDDWVSGSANLTTAKAAFVSGYGTPSPSNKIWISLMLGTNDARIPYHNSKATYKANLINICNDLRTSGYAGVILHYPPWASTSNAAIDTQAQTLLLSYLDAINEIVVANPGFVFLGDDQAYLLFKNNAGWLSDGVHPDTTHSGTLGDLQGFAIYRATTTGLATSASSTITKILKPSRQLPRNSRN